VRIVHTNGRNKDFYNICEKLDCSLNDNVPDRKMAGLNSIYKIEDYEDVFLMYDGKKAVGSAGFWQHDSEACELIRVFIDDAYRGQGLAGKLIDKVEELAKSRGYTKISLRTWSTTPYSIRAYEKLGFALTPASNIKYTDKFPKALPLASIRVYMSKDLV